MAAVRSPSDSSEAPSSGLRCSDRGSVQTECGQQLLDTGSPFTDISDMTSSAARGRRSSSKDAGPFSVVEVKSHRPSTISKTYTKSFELSDPSP